MIAIHLITSTVLGLVVATTPPLSEPQGAPIAMPLSAAAAGQAAAVPVVREKRYCIKDRREGADIRPKICRTRDEWRARGFDPVVTIGGI
ncbi:hypothetical protein [uncultured Sphingomonas sp.]|uniref:hypothetical protein n=1 Tax=uncultured Sphingomonas sp. TaxID=158754 RepID=UPI0025EC161C|nr:hypothetical protein [uncultured Sphingomonas sp.]